MNCWITSTEGSINFKVQAEDTGEAFEKLGQSLGYIGFDAMCADLGYVGSDFNLAVIEVEQADYDADADRRHIARQRADAELSGFRNMRRVTG